MKKRHKIGGLVQVRSWKTFRRCDNLTVMEGIMESGENVPHRENRTCKNPERQEKTKYI